jgi:hypothetical protein
MIYTWKISEVSSENDVILHAKYHVTATDEDVSVETEGNWWFSDKIVKKPFEQVQEQDIAQWIEKESIQDGVSTIKSNLDKQIANLKNSNKSYLPWNPPVFKPTI